MPKRGEWTLLGLEQLEREASCCCRQFREIAAVQGNKSQDKKIKLIQRLLVSSKDIEPGYIMRALQVSNSTKMTCLI